GLIVSVTAAPGEAVAAGQKLFALEAMKMETTVYAERAGRVAEVLVSPGTQVAAGDLLLQFETSDVSGVRARQRRLQRRDRPASAPEAGGSENQLFRGGR